MKQKPASKKIRLWLFIGVPVIIIIGILIFALSGVNTFLKPLIKNALAKVVIDGSDSLYKFSLQDYSVGPGGRSVMLNGLDIQLDSSRFKLLKAAGLLPAVVFSVQVDNAGISGLSPWQLWRKRNIFCKSIELNGAKVNLYQQIRRSDTAKTVSSKNLYALLKPDINDISIQMIKVVNADVSLTTIYQKTGSNTKWHLENAGLILDDILVNATATNDSSKVWYAKNLRVTLDSFKTSSSNGIYSFSTKNANYNFEKRTAKIEGLSIQPAISKAEFYKRMGHEADLFTISIPGIAFENFNAGALISENIFQVSSIHLDNPDIDIYKDRNAGRDFRSKMGRYPHELLLKAPLKISVKEMVIRKGKLVVSQKSAKTGETGSFRFNNVHGNILNISNLAMDIATSKWCRAKLSAAFQGNNAMDAVFAFDLASDNGHFITDARLATLHPSDINQVFRSLAQAELETFNLDKLNYHVEGNDYFAVGNLNLRYHDLKLNVLKKEENGEIKKKGLVSLLANAIKLYDHNPMPHEEERIAVNVRDQRVPYKNYFSIVVGALLKCTQQIAIKGKKKELPGLGGPKPGTGNNRDKKNAR